MHIVFVFIFFSSFLNFIFVSFNKSTYFGDGPLGPMQIIHEKIGKHIPNAEMIFVSFSWKL